MADVPINKRHKESGLWGKAQGHSMECEQAMAWPGSATSFSLTVRDLLTASPSELMRRFTECINRFFEGTSISPMTVWSPSIAIFEQDGHIKVCVPGRKRMVAAMMRCWPPVITGNTATSRPL